MNFVANAPIAAGMTLALALGWSGPARADVCPAPGARASWLRVAFVGDGFTPPVRARVLQQLGADLKSHRLAFCERDAGAVAAPGAAGEGADPREPGPDAPLADIALTLSSTSVLSLDVRDAVTDKRTTRELPLASVPRDALPLSVALAAEELLRASWIEDALPQPALADPDEAAARAAVARRPPPEAVAGVNAEAVASLVAQSSAASPARGASSGGSASGGSPRFTELALLGAAVFATGGQTDLGGDLRVAYGGRFALSAKAGFRVAPAVSSAHGTVEGRELVAGLGASYALTPRDARFGADLGVRAELLDAHFAGVAASGATATSGSSLGAALGGALGAWITLTGPWHIVGEVTAGAPLRAVTASDQGSPTTGVSGALLGVSLGVSATIPD